MPYPVSRGGKPWWDDSQIGNINGCRSSLDPRRRWGRGMGHVGDQNSLIDRRRMGAGKTVRASLVQREVYF